MLPLVFRVLRYRIEKCFKVPKPIDQSRRHCGRGASPAGFAGKPWTPTEIVVGDVQGHRCRKIAETLRESQGEPSEALDESADRQVCRSTLDVHISLRSRIPRMFRRVADPKSGGAYRPTSGSLLDRGRVVRQRDGPGARPDRGGTLRST
jgi:hypothetical protein